MILCSESWVYELAEPDIRDQDNKDTYLTIEQCTGSAKTNFVWMKTLTQMLNYQVGI